MVIDYKKLCIYCVVVLLSYSAGFYCGYKWAAGTITPTTITKTITEKLPQQVETITKTQVVYVPKETTTVIKADGTKEVAKEKTDVDIKTAKTNLVVNVNGNEQTINKADNEAYIFDKNKLELTQSSKATVDITVPTIDNTKRWAAGIGYGNNGVAYTIKMPIGKKLDGWAYKDNDSKAIGIAIGF